MAKTKKVARETAAQKIMRNRIRNFADPTLHGKSKRKELPPDMEVPSREERGGHPFYRP